MILFKPQHVDMILSGKKTQTRRTGNKRWNVGAIHQARTQMMVKDSTFARLRILEVRREFAGGISETDARAEGYCGRNEFIEAFRVINKIANTTTAVRMQVWVIRFEVISDD